VIWCGCREVFVMHLQRVFGMHNVWHIGHVGATENAGVENAGVNRMKRQPEIISRKLSLDLSLFF